MLFKKALHTEIRAIKAAHGISDDKAFLFWFAKEILELDEDATLEALSVEGANDKGIDLFHVDDDEGRVLIAQGKYSKDLDYKAKEKEVANLESSLNWLASPEALRKDGKPELAQAAEDYLAAQKDGYGIELLYIYAGKKSTNIEKKIIVYNQNKDNADKRRFFRHYHVDLLQNLWEEIQGGRQRIEKDHLKIAGGWCKTDGKFGSALLATAPGSEIVRLYRQYEERLFDRNVRLFLGARKGSVNAGIAATIKDHKDRANFWAYNNGLTIICDDFKEKKDSIELSNFSIVNGCQTAVSLAENGGDATEVSVLVRLIAASAEIVDDVIRYTNSQNPIRTWDIASQDKTQRRLKSEFENLKKPHIYLTRRGDQPSAGDLKKYREKGKLRKIRIDIAGQYMAAFRGQPVLAYKHKAFIFSRYHDDVFPSDVKVEEVLFCWICGEVCKEINHEMIRDRGPEDVRILKKGGTLFTLAILSEILKKRNGATYLSYMPEEHADSTRTRQRLHKYSQYATMLYLDAVRDEMEIQKQELTTLIRQKEFFDKVLDRTKRGFEKNALNPEWLEKALPKLI